MKSKKSLKKKRNKTQKVKSNKQTHHLLPNKSNLSHRGDVLQNEELLAFRHHQGPLPDPETLQQYENIQPGLVERIVTMAEKEQSHRHVSEKRALDTNIELAQKDQSQKSKGQIFAFFLTLLFGGGSIYIILQGHDWAG